MKGAICFKETSCWGSS